MKKPVVNKSQQPARIRKRRNALFVPLIILTCLANQCFVVGISAVMSIFPKEEVMLDVCSTFAEIIAGMYGIILASYTFFVSHIDTLSASDTTLDYIVETIKERFKWLISALTFNVFIVLISYIILNYIPIPENVYLNYFYRLFFNELVACMIFSIVLILFYSVHIITPDFISKEAAALREHICSSKAPRGSVSLFMDHYHQIEEFCHQLYLTCFSNWSSANSEPRIKFVLNMLHSEEMLEDDLIHTIRKIAQYHACTVHCKELRVTQEMCVLAEETLLLLKQKAK